MLNSLHNIFDGVMQSTDLPLLTAFVLGVLVAINPCQLAINVSALSYCSVKGSEGNNSAANSRLSTFNYVLGRTITYTVMGWVLMCLIGGGKNIEGWSLMLSKAEVVLPYALITIGLYMIFRAVRPHNHHDDNCHNCRQIIRRNGPLGSLVLGMTLALAFCPESAIFYFGMMLPMAMGSSGVGVLVPAVFSVGAAVPVLALAWVMQKAVSRAYVVSSVFEHVQRWLNALVGVLFIVIAILCFQL